MLSESNRYALEDMRDNMARAVRFVDGLDLEGFLADDKSFYAAQAGACVGQRCSAASPAGVS